MTVLRSKPDKVTYDGTHLIRRAAGMDDQKHDRYVLDPKYAEQAPEFWAALERVWIQGGWTVYLDELFYLDRLRLRPSIERLLTQGRSKGITVASGLQRPVSVSRFALSQSEHIISFRVEGRDAKELGYATADWVGRELSALPKHHFGWYKRPDGLWIGRLNLETDSLEGEYIRR